MNVIEEILNTLEISEIKERLSQNRKEIKLISKHLYNLESSKKDLTLKLKFVENQLKSKIAEETVPGSGKKKFSSEGLREAEFIVQSAEDTEISSLRDDINNTYKDIQDKKIELEVNLKYYEELILDYRLAIELVGVLKKG